MGLETAIGVGLLSTFSGIAQSKGAARDARNAAKLGQRSYLGEMMSALDAQEAVYKRLPGLERTYQPIMQSLQRDTLMGQMGVMGDLYNDASSRSAGIARNALNQFAPAYETAGRIGQSQFYRNLGTTSSRMISDIERRAASELALGGQLSPDEIIRSQQATRAALGARGLQMGNQAVASEVLNEYGLSRQREAERIAAAQNAISLRTGANAMAYQQYGQPLAAMVGQVSPTSLIGMATQYNAGLGSQLFQQESDYNASIYGSNANVNVQSALAAAQAKAGMAQGLMSMGGQLASAGMSYAGATNAANIEAKGKVNAAALAGGKPLPYTL